MSGVVDKADDTSVFYWRNEVRRCQIERDAAEKTYYEAEDARRRYKAALEEIFSLPLERMGEAPDIAFAALSVTR